MMHAEDDEIIELERIRAADDDPVVRVIPWTSAQTDGVLDATDGGDKDPWSWWRAHLYPPSDGDRAEASVGRRGSKDWLHCAIDGITAAARRTATHLCQRGVTSGSHYDSVNAEEAEAVHGAGWLHRLMHCLSLEQCRQAWRAVLQPTPPPVLLLSWHGNDKSDASPCPPGCSTTRRSRSDDGETTNGSNGTPQNDAPRAKKYRWEGCETPWQNRSLGACGTSPTAPPRGDDDVPLLGSSSDRTSIHALGEDFSSIGLEPPAKLRISEAFYRRAQGSCWSAARRVSSSPTRKLTPPTSLEVNAVPPVCHAKRLRVS